METCPSHRGRVPLTAWSRLDFFLLAERGVWEHPEGQGQHVPRGLALGSGMRARPPLELDRVSLIPSLMLLDHCPGHSFACGEGGVETMLREAQWS